MTAITMRTLQNHAALNCLLASQGKLVLLLVNECCTFVPDHNATIQEITNHLKGIAKTLHKPVISGLFEWL